MKKLKEYIEDSLADSEDFWVRELKSEELTSEPIRLNYTMIALCVNGNAVFSIDTKDYDVVVGSEAFLLYDTVFS